ncbi:5-formyltetrahydrofolate cyclo-ligase [Pediococcus acidilactici]|uniref:5-formyltetrahydrofolate cyclo-ligase n=1 Tax=Pediococcus acidilactici TaxID=1254 RepID=UPI00186A5C92|nr:5-formyltetrahydrofolate cyclo-ligase [Pediococcus acidilactici]QOP74333.1 5-formyltetrahydrofolate cyclo-ligase [Pediococcus acidilactici]
MDKKQFRQRQIEQLRQLSPDVKAKLEEQIMERFFEQTAVSTAKNVAITLSQKFELNTAPIIRRLQERKISVLVPKTFENRRMEFVSLTSETQLAPQAFGILEPVDGIPVAPTALDLIVVPGLAYEQTGGNRLGFGGGYYDRYLKRAPQAHKIVLAFNQQVYSAAHWPVDQFDVTMDLIITEQGVQFKNERIR